MDLFAVISALYDSEINCGVQTFWDAGIDAWVGDEANGKSERRNFERDDMGSAADWLHEAALRLYPASDYALKHKEPA